MRRHVVSLLVRAAFMLTMALGVVGCVAWFPGGDSSGVVDGMERSQLDEVETRNELLERFGQPASRQLMTKTDEGIFGPIESLWSTLPIGARVELWSYPVAGGAVEVYFVDGSDRIAGTAFASDGAVY